MNIYPAIDIYQGRVVRLKRGDYNEETVYSDHPEEIALEWERQGAKWLHVVDLEGAKDGEIKNLDSLIKIRKAVKCQIEFGGGLRSVEAIERVLDSGVNRVIVGTRALDEEFIKVVLDKFKSKIAIGLDVRDGRVQMEGWLKEGGKELHEAIEWLNNFPIETIIYTDIKKDGMLEGPNFDGLKEVLAGSNAGIILSGGVAAIHDIERASHIKATNFEGVIIGKAIYENKFTVQEAASIAYS